MSTPTLARTAWRPVQGPADARPGAVAGTGHVVGTVYASHYWGDPYLVTLAHVDGSVTVESLTGPDKGRPRTHRTALHMDGKPDRMRDDHPV